MKKALIPGTFDPPSHGHLDIITRALAVCDKLYVGIASNAAKEKSACFTPKEKKELLEQATKGLKNLEVVIFKGLVVDFAKENTISFLIRGLRAFSDFEYEFRMAIANRRLSGIETIFLMSDEKHAHISSTLIREIAGYGKHLRDFVPASIEKQVFERLKG